MIETHSLKALRPHRNLRRGQALEASMDRRGIRIPKTFVFQLKTEAVLKSSLQPQDSLPYKH
jgi:hypothetical protein